MDKLQNAAGRILVRSGLKAATTRRIAAEAGLSEMTLFRRFGTKERLLSAVMDRLLLEETARVPIAQGTPGDLRTRLLECVKAQVTFINRNLPLIRIFVGDPEHFGEEERNILREVFSPMRREIRQILAQESLPANTLPPLWIWFCLMWAKGKPLGVFRKDPRFRIGKLRSLARPVRRRSRARERFAEWSASSVCSRPHDLAGYPYLGCFQSGSSIDQ